MTNTTKCRPPQNRKPEASEEKACRVFLNRELEIVDPTHVLALGNHALRAVTGLWGITKYVGIWHSVPRPSKSDLLVLANYHPAYILRNPRLVDEFQYIVKEFVDSLENDLGMEDI